MSFQGDRLKKIGKNLEYTVVSVTLYSKKIPFIYLKGLILISTIKEKISSVRLVIVACYK